MLHASNEDLRRSQLMTEDKWFHKDKQVFSRLKSPWASDENNLIRDRMINRWNNKRLSDDPSSEHRRWSSCPPLTSSRSEAWKISWSRQRSSSHLSTRRSSNHTQQALCKFRSRLERLIEVDDDFSEKNECLMLGISHLWRINKRSHVNYSRTSL